MRTITLRLISAIGLVLLIGAQSPGATINVGTHTLLPNTAGQTITISIVGTEAVIGMTSRVQIGDGGVPIPPGTAHSGPLITSLDTITGTIFSTGGFGQTPTPGNVFPQYREDQTASLAGTATANGLLMTLTVDTTGFFFGDDPWDLILSDNNVLSPNNSTFLTDATSGLPIPLTIIDGQIQFIPEPSMLPLWGLVPVLGGVYYWRRRRSCRRKEEAAA